MSPEGVAKMRDLVGKHESCRLRVYDDKTGRPLKKGDTLRGRLTVGWGFNLSDRDIPQATADQWRDDDLLTCVKGLSGRYSWFDDLSEVRQAVCVDMAYNVGLDGFHGFVRLISALAREAYGPAAAEIIDSTIAPNRAKELAQMMRTGQWGEP